MSLFSHMQNVGFLMTQLVYVKNRFSHDDVIHICGLSCWSDLHLIT